MVTIYYHRLFVGGNLDGIEIDCDVTVDASYADEVIAAMDGETVQTGYMNERYIDTFVTV